MISISAFVSAGGRNNYLLRILINLESKFDQKFEMAFRFFPVFQFKLAYLLLSATFKLSMSDLFISRTDFQRVSYFVLLDFLQTIVKSCRCTLSTIGRLRAAVLTS